MPLVKDAGAVDSAAVAEAVTAAAEANTAAVAATSPVETVTETVVEDAGSADAVGSAAAGDDVLEPAAEPEPVVASTGAQAGAVATTNEGGAVSVRQASQAAVLHEMADAGFEGLKLDYTSFPNIVLKDGEFQIAGSTRSFDAVKGFTGVVTGTREKFAYRVGGDDDGDVVFAYHKDEFTNPETEAFKKLQEWRASGLTPELKTYLEAYVMVGEVFGDQEKDLAGELVVVQISPTSTGRFSGFGATQRFKHKVNPDGYLTHFLRGEKITSSKFPYYPWAFKFGGLV